MMNLGEDEEEKIKGLKARVAKLSAQDAQTLILQDIAESLAIIAGKIGRKLL